MRISLVLLCVVLAGCVETTNGATSAPPSPVMSGPGEPVAITSIVSSHDGRCVFVLAKAPMGGWRVYKECF